MKKVLGIILSLSLVLAMVMPSVDTKAEGIGSFDFSTIAGISVSFEGELLEGDMMELSEYSPEANGPVNFVGYEIHSLTPIVAVNYSNGTPADVYRGWPEVNMNIVQKYGTPMIFRTNQATTPWEVGQNEVSVSFGNGVYNFECKANATVKGNPVSSIEGIYHGIIVENSTVIIDNWDVEFIFTFSDGSKESYSYYDSVLGEMVVPTLTPQDLNEGTWDAGEHYITGKTHGREFKVKVNVLSLAETPIQSISAVATKDLVADWHAVMNDADRLIFSPESAYPKVELTYKDGTKDTMYYEALRYAFEGVSPTLTLDNYSIEGTGKRTATLEFYGHKCTFDVNVVENPVASISAVTTKPIIKNWREFPSLVLDGGMIITVTYKDGTKISGTPNELLDVFYDYPQDYTYGKDFVIGKNTVEVEFLGKFFDVEFELVEDPNPVVGLEAKVKEGAVLYENPTTAGEVWYEYGHIVDVTLTFKDGTKITGNVDEVNQKLENINIIEVFAEPIQVTNVGEYTSTVSYETLEKEVTVKVVENPYSKATISNENGFTIVLEKANGEKETHIAKRFSPSGSMGSNSNMFGYIVTDKGTLPVEINFGGGRRADYTDVSSMYIHGIKSNELKGCTWLEQQLIVEMYGEVPEVSVNHSAEELKSLVITEADYAMGREENVSVKLVISEKETVSETDQALLDEATESLDDYEEGVVVDLTLYKEYPNMMGTVTEKVPEPNGKVSITMAVPEEVLASGANPEDIKMVRIHNGETTVLPCTYDKETQTITFETDAFSTYSMVYKVAANDTDNKNDSNSNNDNKGESSNSTGSSTTTNTGSNTTTNKPTPNTGDSNSLVGYMTLCVAAIAVILVEKKRRFCAK